MHGCTLHSPFRWKKTTAKVLIQRAIRICSSKWLHDEKLNMIKHSLCDVSNYSRKFARNIIDYNLHKRNGIPPNLSETSNSRKIFINLKYAGQTGEQLMLKMKKIVKKFLKDGVKTKIIYNLSKLS